MLPSLITGIVVVGGLIIGFGAKLYLGNVKGEIAENIIEKIVKAESGVDLQPIFDIDNNPVVVPPTDTTDTK
jgi:hypothetical protein